mgnify:CR=1 FL=1
MAVPLDEVDLLAAGVDASRPTAGTFALNMIHREGAWSVREGFGQVAQYNTTMSTNPKDPVGRPPSYIWGYSRHVGSYLLRTRFGHMQVVSILEANNIAGNARTWNAGYLGQSNWMTPVYCVSIHDLTTNERWEEPIYRSTSEGSRMVVPLYKRLGQYLTSRDLDAEGWVSHGGKQMWFAEWDGRLLFGNNVVGVMLYSPATFNGTTRKAVDLTRETDWVTGHCESAIVTRVSPSKGLYYGAGQGYAYITDSSFPAPTTAATYGDRVVYASGRNLFFSDPFYPTSIMTLNVIDVPSDSDITGLAVSGETLIITTLTQTWSFRAPPSTAVSQGRGASLISSTVGCIGPGAIINVGGAVAWCDTTGVYISTGGSVTKISEQIDRFFTGFITDPVTLWYPLQGAISADSPTGTPPRRSITLSLKPELVTMSYSEELDALFLSVPDENVTLCYADSQWSVWSFDSNATNTAATGALQNIKNPQVISREGRTMLVGGLDSQQFTDASSYSNPVAGVGDNTTSRSYYILEYGRGGAIDRSIDNEDYRTVTGKYIVWESSAGIVGGTDTPHDYYGGWATVDPWIKVASGYTFPGGVAANERTFLLPISIVPPKQWGQMPSTAVVSGRSVGRISIIFTFDNTKWEPVIRAGADIDYRLPSERASSVGGYSTGLGVVRAETLLGVADAAGPRIQILWDGYNATTGWIHNPYMNLNALRKTTILYIPMKCKSAALTAELSGMGLAPFDAATPARLIHTNSGTGALEDIAPLSVAFWEQWSIGAPRKDDNVAQPVDWAYKSDEIGLESPERLIARGLSVTLLSHGQGDDTITTYPFRLFNTLVAADQKMTMAQPVDHSGQYTWAAAGGYPVKRPVSVQTNVYPNPGGPYVIRSPHETLRNRLIRSTGELNKVIFDHPTAGVGVWGTANSLVVTNGDVLIADEQVDSITTSDGLKCTSFSYLMFGFIQNRAETIKLEIVKGLYRRQGAGRRRRGR